jgi:GntR family transcriptional regulator / MocR family aminotransferase
MQLERRNAVNDGAGRATGTAVAPAHATVSLAEKGNVDAPNGAVVQRRFDGVACFRVESRLRAEATTTQLRRRQLPERGVDVAASSPGVVPYIAFDRTSGVPLYQQIYEGCRQAIISGRIPVGQRLPSTRALAAMLGISRFPVITAFDLLLQEGYLEGKRGSGTFVRHHVSSQCNTSMTLPLALPLEPANGAAPSARDGTSPEDRFGPFAAGIPALDQFPSEIWARLVRRHARPAVGDLAGGDPAGHLPLRRAIAAYLRTARAVDCDPDQVLIVSGSQLGLRVAVTALVGRDAAVCVEDPSYRVTQRAMRSMVAEVIPVGVDRDGLDVVKLDQVGGRAKAVYVTPSNQYPLGMSMSAARRVQLLDWAERHEAWIIEDDYACEFRYSGVPVPSLQGMRPSSRIVYLGTFSSLLFPALRVAYIVVPRELVTRCIRVREGLERNSQSLYQLVLTDFLTEGHLARHLRRMHAVYVSRRDAVIGAIHEYAGGLVTLGIADAGLSLVAFLPDAIDDRAVVRRAAQHGLFPLALSECYARHNARKGLILGFGGSDERILADGVQELVRLIRSSS